MQRKERVIKCLMVVSNFILCLSLFLLNAKAKLHENGKYEVYLNSNSSNCSVVCIEKKDAFFYINRYGESCEIASDCFNIIEAIKRYEAKIIFSEQTENGISYYCYTNKLKYKKMINDKEINLHIHWTKERVKIGTPLIYGSY